MERISSASFAAAASASWRASMGVDPECASWPKNVMAWRSTPLVPNTTPSGKCHALQNGALFDVQLNVSRRVLLLARRFGKTVDRKAATLDRVFQADAVLVGAAAVGFDARSTRECRRSQQTAAKARAFFVGPVNQTDGNRRAAAEFFRETAQHFETSRDTEASVQPSAVRHGVEMAADDQRLLRRAWQRGPAIAGGIVVVLNREALLFSSEILD